MSPAEKLDEIVRALEEDVAYLESAHIDNLRAHDVAKRLSRALTLARELRDNAVEGLLASGQTEE